MFNSSLQKTVAFALIGCAALARSSDAQEVNGDVALRGALVCASCDAARLRRDIAWVEWVADAANADVHVVVLVQTDTSGAARYVVQFTGLGRFDGRVDTLTYVPAATATADARAAGLLHTVQLGMVRYAASTPVGPSLRIVFQPQDTAAAPRPTPPQPVSSSPPRPTPPANQSKRWAAVVDLGFTGSTGNSELIALTSGVRIRHLQTNLFRLDWSAAFRYGESNGSVAARNLQSKLDFDLGPGARVAPFIAASAERDPFRRLALRGRSGTGIRYSFYRSPGGEASLRAAANYSHERYTPEATKPARTDGVWSVKLNASRKLGENIRIENSSNFDPAMSDVGDYNLEITSKLSTRITRRVALSFSHTYVYDSTPPADVHRADQRFQTGLSMEF